MRKFLIRRLFLSIPTFLGASVLVFVLANLAPGSPLDIMAQQANFTDEARAALEKELGLDKPILTRYGIWLKNIFQGNMGNSTRVNKPVWNVIKERIGPTLLITVTALVLCLLVSIPLGVLSALKPHGFCDNVSSVLSFSGTSIPGFFLCLILIYLLAIKLKIFPTSGMYNSITDKTFGSLIRHMIMPTFVLSFSLMGDFIKQTRGSMMEVLNEEYVKTARSKGLSERRVVVYHILRNGLIPIVSATSMAVPLLIGGSVVIEKIFSWPGIGSLMMISITTRDYNTIMGVTALIALTVMVSNYVLDIVYAILDPRIASNTGKGE